MITAITIADLMYSFRQILLIMLKVVPSIVGSYRKMKTVLINQLLLGYRKQEISPDKAFSWL
jgi:hypothetical protein